MSSDRSASVFIKARTIFFTDIVGSSRFFSSQGNVAGLEMIKRHNQYLFPIVEHANGRVIKTIGDSIMAVFEHPTDALKAAFSMQAKLVQIRQSVPEDKDLHIRIGIHYGLVSESGNDIFGDAVNMAERIKSNAGPDIITISRTLRDLVKIDRRFDFKSIGARELKGNVELMELFELTQAPEVRAQSFLGKIKKHTVKLFKKQAVVIPLILAFIIAAVLLKVFLFTKPYDAIAVMPFRNLNSDKESDYLAIAITSELNVQLLKIESLVIRPLNATLPYKGKEWKAEALKEELQVSKIISGSFIRSEGQLRVNVEIIDAYGRERPVVQAYQGKDTDTLNLLDQVSRQVANALRLQIMDNKDIFKYGTENIPAYDNYLKGVAYLSGEVTKESNNSAISCLETAVTLDPKFARAYASLAYAYALHFWWNFSNDTMWLDKAEKTARQSLELDKNLIEAHHALAYTLEAKGKRLEATREYISCFRLDKRYVPALIYMARYAFYMGEFETALEVLELIGRIDPTYNFYMRRAINLFFAGRIGEGLNANKLAEGRAHGVDELTQIAMNYVWLGDIPSARRVLETLTKLDPQALSISEVKAWIYTGQKQYKEAESEMGSFSMRASWGIMQEMAALYALQGEKEKSLAWLEKAIASGGPSYAWFISDHFKVLKDDPRYKELIKKLSDEYMPLRAEFKELLFKPNP